MRPTLTAQTAFQSTLPMRGVTPWRGCWPVTISISIHAPHAGSDYPYQKGRYNYLIFNPRSPCGERQQKLIKSRNFHELFAQICLIFYIDNCFQAALRAKILCFFGAKRPGKSCALPSRTTPSAFLRHRTPASRQSAQCGFDSVRQDCKSAGCPFPGRSA